MRDSSFSFAINSHAQERETTEEQQAVIQNGGEIVVETIRPENLPDLTKGEPLPPSKNKPFLYYLGPTGISGYMSGGAVGDQLLVDGTIKGSPADGKFLKGDVITGINGVKFKAGGHLGQTIGYAIIEAEKEENGGKMVLQVWRDKNHLARTGAKNIAGTDIDELINRVEGDNSLYDWKKDEERNEEVRKIDMDKFPIDPTTLDIEIKIRTFPAYSDTAPYDCPKTAKILEDAWKVLEQRFVVDPKNPAQARAASSKPWRSSLPESPSTANLSNNGSALKTAHGNHPPNPSVRGSCRATKVTTARNPRSTVSPVSSVRCITMPRVTTTCFPLCENTPSKRPWARARPAHGDIPLPFRHSTVANCTK